MVTKPQEKRTNVEWKKKDLHKSKIIKKMAIGKDISIITINVNGLNAPNKRHRLAERIQKQEPYSAAYKRLTSNPKTHTNWK